MFFLPHDHSTCFSPTCCLSLCLFFSSLSHQPDCTLGDYTLWSQRIAVGFQIHMSGQCQRNTVPGELILHVLGVQFPSLALHGPPKLLRATLKCRAQNHPKHKNKTVAEAMRYINKHIHLYVQLNYYVLRSQNKNEGHSKGARACPAGGPQFYCLNLSHYPK